MGLGDTATAPGRSTEGSRGQSAVSDSADEVRRGVQFPQPEPDGRGGDRLWENWYVEERSASPQPSSSASPEPRDPGTCSTAASARLVSNDSCEPRFSDPTVRGGKSRTG